MLQKVHLNDDDSTAISPLVSYKTCCLKNEKIGLVGVYPPIRLKSLKYIKVTNYSPHIMKQVFFSQHFLIRTKPQQKSVEHGDEHGSVQEHELWLNGHRAGCIGCWDGQCLAGIKVE